MTHEVVSHLKHLCPKGSAGCLCHDLSPYIQRRLSVTLRAAYGEGAWQLVPCSFALPDELPLLRQWMGQRLGSERQPGRTGQEPHQPAASGATSTAAGQNEAASRRAGEAPEAGSAATARAESSGAACSSGEVFQPDGLGEASSSGAREASASSGGAANELWILKTAQHLGQGLKLVTAEQLVQEAASR
jgi:hypothetical protein